MTAISASFERQTGFHMGRKPIAGGPYWFAVVTKPRGEETADEHLRRLGYMTFYPFQRLLKRTRIPGTNRFRVSWSEAPYFPRYIFVAVRFEGESLYDVDEADGVATVWRGPGKTRPMLIPHGVMDVLMELGDRRGQMEVSDPTELKEGSKFMVAEGNPFAGFIARISDLSTLDKSGSLKAFLNVFGSEREVTLPAWAVAEIVG